MSHELEVMSSHAVRPVRQWRSTIISRRSRSHKKRRCRGFTYPETYLTKYTTCTDFFLPDWHHQKYLRCLEYLLIDSGSERVPHEPQGHLPRVIHHQVYYDTKIQLVTACTRGCTADARPLHLRRIRFGYCRGTLLIGKRDLASTRQTSTAWQRSRGHGRPVDT